MKTIVTALARIVEVSWIYLLAGAGMPTMDMGGGKVMLMPPQRRDRRVLEKFTSRRGNLR